MSDAFGRAQKELERAQKTLCPSKGRNDDAFERHIKIAQTEALIDIAESLHNLDKIFEIAWRYR